MRVNLRFLTVAAALVSAACGQSPPMDEQLKRDLEAASAGGVELAPRSGQQVVSAIELAPQSKPAIAPTRRVPAPSPRRETKVQQPVPRTEPAASRPAPAPRVSPPPPGGYKTMEEVIRNAPFPIKP
jgi:hypothetical protein